MSDPGQSQLYERVRALELNEAAAAQRDQERDRKIEEIHNAVCGDSDSHGLKTRVDRIEQRHGFFEKLFVVIGSILTLALSVLGLRQHQ